MMESKDHQHLFIKSIKSEKEIINKNLIFDT